MEKRLTPAERETLAEIQAMLPHLRRLEHLLTPERGQALVALLEEMGETPEEVQKTAAALYELSESVGPISKLLRHLQTLSDIAADRKATDRVWGMLERLSNRVQATKTLWLLVSGAVALVLWLATSLPS